jgi:imidazolonepropionase-like amidohydrolase
MISRFASTILLVFSLTALIPTFAAPPTDRTILLTNINVIDATGSPVQAGMNVLIENGYITAIERESISISDVEKIDGTGRFLIPGLWDMHVHWYDDKYLSLFIANGVTGIRQMWGFPMHYYWKAMVNYDEDFVAPRVLVGSVIIDGPEVFWPGSLSAKTELEGRNYVRRFNEMGADFIKVYGGLKKDVYFAIADESRRVGIPFAGHVPNAVTVIEASDAGQKSIEHLSGIAVALSSEKERLQKAIINASSRSERLAAGEQARDTFDPALMAPLFEQLKRNGTWQSPTLTVLRNIAYIRERSKLDQDRLQYLPSSITGTWDPNKDFRFKNYSEQDWEIQKRLFEHSKMIVGELNRAGVKIIAGTDVLNPYCFPGFSLHDELALLVESGLTSMQALQAATRNAAEFSGRLDQLGTVEVGKIADLVLLDADPLKDIRNTTKISAVILTGRIRNREVLDSLLEESKVRAMGQD